MMLLTKNERQLVIEAAFAGINHGLHLQVHSILLALPLLVENTSMQTLCRAVLLAGLNEFAEARQALVDVDLPEVETLKAWLKYSYTGVTDKYD